MELWRLTRAQFDETVFPIPKVGRRYKLLDGRVVGIVGQTTHGLGFVWTLKNIATNEHLRMTTQDLNMAVIGGKDPHTHRSIVLEALERGYPVPRFVLRDHPDLERKYRHSAIARNNPESESLSEVETLLNHYEYEGELAAGWMKTNPRKEPWRMTRKEFDRYAFEQEGKRLFSVGVSELDISRRRYKPSKPGTEWSGPLFRYHRKQIESALAKGKPVPPEVLADYPELAVNPPAPEGKTGIVTDPTRVQEIRNSIAEGRLTLRTGKFNGRKLSTEELLNVRKQVERDLAKIGESRFLGRKGNEFAPRSGFTITDVTPEGYGPSPTVVLSNYHDLTGEYGSSPAMRRNPDLVAGKEPWMMTKEEYRNQDEALIRSKRSWETAMSAVGGSERWGDTRRFEGRRAGNRLDRERRAHDWWDRMFTRSEAKHETIIRRALSEGKPVPPVVLADYPDLMGQPSRSNSGKRPILVIGEAVIVDEPRDTWHHGLTGIVKAIIGDPRSPHSIVRVEDQYGDVWSVDRRKVKLSATTARRNPMERHESYSNPRRPTKEWTLWKIDAWGNEEDGWEANDRSKHGIVYLPEDPTDRDIMLALKKALVLVETAKPSDLDIGGDDKTITVDDALNGQPLWTLELEEMMRSNTGEPDQDYDHAFFDAIVRQLSKAGFKGATHKEFDKYAGVYLSIPSIDKFWIEESYFTGDPYRESGEKWRSAQLIDPEGSPVSSTRGDYFMKPKNYVLKGYLLRLQPFSGKWTEIQDPIVGDLPDLLEVKRGVKFIKGTRVEVVVFKGENSEKTAEVIQTEDGTVNASKLIHLCREIQRDSR